MNTIVLLLLMYLAWYFYVGFRNFKKSLKAESDLFDKTWAGTYWVKKSTDHLGEILFNTFCKCFFWGFYRPYKRFEENFRNERNTK